MTAATPSQAILNPAARVLWRSPRSVQLELGDRRMVVDGIGSDIVRQLIGRPDPHAKPSDPSAAATDDGPPATGADLLAALTDAGFAWPVAADNAPLTPPRPRLGGELAALTVRHGRRAADLLAARRRYCVAVHGTGRAGPQLAAVLAAAGIGRVYLPDRSPARLHHALPGGVQPDDEGRPLTVAAAHAIARAAPETDTTPLAFGERPDLVVLAHDDPVDDERRDALHATESTHLVVRLGLDHGVVGPLVIPGLTSCLRCADLHRLDRDPAWTALAVQLGVPRRYGDASEVAIAATVAGLAALEVLTFLDGGDPATIEGTLELHRPDWRVRRRSWHAHPDCDCSHSGGHMA